MNDDSSEDAYGSTEYGLSGTNLKNYLIKKKLELSDIQKLKEKFL